MQKGSVAVPLLVVILLSLIIGSGYYFLNRPKSTSPVSLKQVLETDKIYTDLGLGFEFKYNKDLTVKEDSEENFNKRGNGDFRKNFKGYVGYEPGKFVGAVAVLDKPESYDQNPFTVWVFDNPEDLNIDKWYGNFWYYPFVWGDFTYTGKSTLAPKEDATVSGQLGKFGIIDYQPGKPKFIYLSKDKKMYLFRVIGESGDKILTTFKFLNNSSPTSSSKNQCGDGVCQEVTCSAIGCPKPETPQSCPADCK